MKQAMKRTTDASMARAPAIVPPMIPPMIPPTMAPVGVSGHRKHICGQVATQTE